MVIQESSFLDPRFKAMPTLGSAELESLRQHIIGELLLLQVGYAEDNTVPGLDDEGGNVTDDGEDIEPPAKKPPSALSSLLGGMFSDKRNLSNNNNLTVRESVDKELKDYENEVSVELDTDPLEWWKAHQLQYPIMAKLAAQWLVVQGTSTSSERVFSTAGLTITDRRSSLQSELVNKLIFLNKNV